MNTNRNSSENLTELVFENKNKAYGAYAIRVSQSDSITKSLLITSLFFGLLAVFAAWSANTKPKLPDTSGNTADSIISVEVEIKPDKIDPVVKKVVEPSAPKTVSGAFVASNSKADSVDVNENQNISKNPNPNGNKDSSDYKGPEVIGGGKGPEKIDSSNIVKDWVDIMPYMDNMMPFIHDNLKYPRAAIENATTGTVVVTFVVEKNGQLTDIKLKSGLGDGCQEEALRVVKMMPLWHPGLTKSIPQRTQCNLPIRFRLK